MRERTERVVWVYGIVKLRRDSWLCVLTCVIHRHTPCWRCVWDCCVSVCFCLFLFDFQTDKQVRWSLNLDHKEIRSGNSLPTRQVGISPSNYRFSCNRSLFVSVLGVWFRRTIIRRSTYFERAVKKSLLYRGFFVVVCCVGSTDYSYAVEQSPLVEDSSIWAPHEL